MSLCSFFKYLCINILRAEGPLYFEKENKRKHSISLPEMSGFVWSLYRLEPGPNQQTASIVDRSVSLRGAG